MSEKLPYEELLNRQLQDIPLPDEDMAWREMEKLLDDDDDDAVIPPPVYKGCGGWMILLGLLFIALMWFFIRPEKWFMQKKDEPKHADQTGINEYKNAVPLRHDSLTAVPLKNADSYVSGQQADTVKDVLEIKKGDDVRRMDNGTAGLSFKQTGTNNKLPPALQNGVNEKPVLIAVNAKRKIIKKDQRVKKPGVENNGLTAEATKRHAGHVSGDKQLDRPHGDVTDPLDTTGIVTISQLPDTAAKNKPGATVSSPKTGVDPVAKKQAPPADLSQKKDFTFGAGIAEQQGIPLSGQKAVPYSYSGRHGSLADYIPSVYLRMYRDKKWFLQSEFRYGAPQYTREFVYSEKVANDTGRRVTTTTSRRVKKTYYHQLPLSFNYYVLPNWSVGSGLLWSKFYGAITEEEIRRKSNLSPIDTLVSKKIVQVKADTDSSFTKSQFHILFETQYQWKRFSLGFRYTQGLQPYIKYVDAAGVPKQEKNHSLQAFLRYELWRSKSK